MVALDFVFVGYGFSSCGGGMYHNAPYNNSFLNGVESYTQPTFQSFQSVIQAFGSVSMMLESTLFAVQNSVRAIVSKFVVVVVDDVIAFVLLLSFFFIILYRVVRLFL